MYTLDIPHRQKEFSMNDLVDLVKRTAPHFDEHSIPRVSDHPAQLTLEEIIRSPRSPSPKRSRKLSSFVVATGVAAGVLLFESLLATTTPSAAAAVKTAVNQMAAATTGKAISRSTVTQDGVPYSGTVSVMWDGDNEDYAFDYSPPGPGKFGIRVVDGQQYQTTPSGTWEKTSQISDPAGLSTTPNRFDVLSTRITFVDAGSEVIDGIKYRHVVATGDLSPLDSATERAGFLFGTNGAEGARTTSLELWIDPVRGIRRIRDSFEGDPDGKHLMVNGETDLYDLGLPVVITTPIS
jgi:hypothetical protein